VIAFLIGVALAAPAQAPAEITLIRQNRQDSTYVVRGSTDALKAFHRQYGEPWTGGMVVDADPSDGTLTYWAYGDRTAAESRALMMPAIFSGLDLGVEEYQESRQFPGERASLDLVARRCGMTEDPFFLTPKRSVQMTARPLSDTQRKCLEEGVQLHAKLPLEPKRSEIKQ